ncbi:MAG: aminodeoxychorismate/anthranilate synthase component II [Termitinemataceae bacterium]|nr:MAG: aminodeoxychorismate/anthranilate synthase component II [Termitinemataceae bacterium]
MVLLIDNYDSFSYNLYQLIGSINSDIRVIRNDEITLDEISALKPTHIFLSPGPGKPRDAGICEALIKRFASTIPIFGVCLGHQAICEVYGATVTYAPKLMHGKSSVIKIDTACKIFAGMPDAITAGRYHSLAASAGTIPPILCVTGTTSEGLVMAVKHCNFEVYGVQFHPESILTPKGKMIVENFLKLEGTSK